MFREKLHTKKDSKESWIYYVLNRIKCRSKQMIIFQKLKSQKISELKKKREYYVLFYINLLNKKFKNKKVIN